MIPITRHIAIQESELSFEFIRSGGPGGQNVNKVATAVQLRFHVDNSPSLPHYVRQRLNKICKKRINSEGFLIITANRFRSQDQNRQDAIERLTAFIEAATHLPKVRRPTKPTHAAKNKRMDHKRHRGKIKQLRRQITNLNE